MGGLFSSEPKVYTQPQPANYYKEEKTYPRTRCDQYYGHSTQTENVRQRTVAFNNPSRNVDVNRSYAYRLSLSSGNNVYNDYNNSPLSSSSRTSRPAPVSLKTIISNADYKRFQKMLFNTMIRQCSILNENALISNENYKLVPLTCLSPEYDLILRKFMRGIVGGDIDVYKIERIENPYLLSQYLLRKLEYQNKLLPVEERILFHGTKREHIDNICSNNFDWRLHGKTKGNIFGKGVSFTPKSTYANHYCGRNDKIMIVVKVLVSKTCAGNRDMTISEYYNRSNLLRYDTSIKMPKKDVLVKYCDDEFYPAYLIHYVGKMFYPNKGFSR